MRRRIRNDPHVHATRAGRAAPFERRPSSIPSVSAASRAPYLQHATREPRAPVRDGAHAVRTDGCRSLLEASLGRAGAAHRVVRDERYGAREAMELPYLQHAASRGGASCPFETIRGHRSPGRRRQVYDRACKSVAPEERWPLYIVYINKARTLKKRIYETHSHNHLRVYACMHACMHTYIH